MQQTIYKAISSFIRQRPGFEPANYSDAASYREDYSRSARDLEDARALLRFCEKRPSIKIPEYSGRLALIRAEDGYVADYCTGQYFPIEYRAAACRLLSSAIWDWLRDQCGCKTGDSIREAAKRELGATIADRWFR